MTRFFAAALTAVTLLVSSGCSNQMKSLEIDARVEVPDFTLQNLQGQPVTLSAYRGHRPVLIVFWATWCPYCVEEMPNLVKLKEKHGDKLQILGVSIQESREKVAAWAKSRNINFPLLLDEEGDVSSKYGVVGVPTLVVVDKDGKGLVAENALNSRILGAIEQSI